jgi:hypothetical protein
MINLKGQEDMTLKKVLWYGGCELVFLWWGGAEI